jgi:hypothetical protein
VLALAGKARCACLKTVASAILADATVFDLVNKVNFMLTMVAMLAMVGDIGFADACSWSPVSGFRSSGCSLT